MTTRSLDRLLFAQGGDCFFCRHPLPREEASIEHLVAVTHGGKDHDENCVVCCKALNQMFGRMSLKEKLGVLLRQKGPFQCPARLGPGDACEGGAVAASAPALLPGSTPLQAVVAHLRALRQQRPTTVEGLREVVQTCLDDGGWGSGAAAGVLRALRERSYIDVQGGKVQAYLLPRGKVH